MSREDYGEDSEGVSEETVYAVLEAYDYLCAVGGFCEGRLEIHHIKWRSRGGSDRKENLTLLCSKHHFQEHEGNSQGWSLGSREDEPTTLPPRPCPPGNRRRRR